MTVPDVQRGVGVVEDAHNVDVDGIAASNVWRVEVPYPTLPGMAQSFDPYFPTPKHHTGEQCLRHHLGDGGGSSTPSAPGCACIESKVQEAAKALLAMLQLLI